MADQTSLFKIIKNPLLKIAAYILVAMIIGIGAVWVLLGICSPVLLLLLIQKW
jgi:UPF0716 family protein affecting phage T7 exclusion